MDMSCNIASMAHFTKNKDRGECSKAGDKDSKSLWVSSILTAPAKFQPTKPLRLVLATRKLKLKLLVWSEPTTKVAERLGVSDVAVSKRCKKLGIEKPPRGYWRKLETGNL